LDIDKDRKRMTALSDRRIIIPALGITQIFAWGSTFYLPAALAPLIASDTGWPYDLTSAACRLDCSLLVLPHRALAA
jgi:hypothetical protein